MKEDIVLSVVIVNWNSSRQLGECVASIFNSRDYRDVSMEIIIVDNFSTDDSLMYVAEFESRIVLVRNLENRGFAFACNQGANRARGEYLLFLNPDTRAFENSISNPLAFMQHSANSNVGICGIRLVDEFDKYTTSAARFPSLTVMCGRVLGFSRLFPRIFPSQFYSADELRASRYVDQVIGAFFLVRRNVFELCAGFDESFFVYFEEVDFSLRAKKIGYDSYFISDASAFHRGGGCSTQVKAARLFYSLRSRLIYSKKHFSRASFFGVVILTLIELPLRVVHCVFVLRSRSDLFNTLTAYKLLGSSCFFNNGLAR